MSSAAPRPDTLVRVAPRSRRGLSESHFALSLYHTDPETGRVMIHAMPVMLLVLFSTDLVASGSRWYRAVWR